MKGLLILGAISGLLLTIPSRSSAAVNYNSSKSNTGNFVISYNPDVVTQAQAKAILDDLDKKGQGAVDESTVKFIMHAHGVLQGKINKIIIEPPKRGQKGVTILLLADPADEAQARGAVDKSSGQTSGKRMH
jgi:hypothetical protein